MYKVYFGRINDLLKIDEFFPLGTYQRARRSSAIRGGAEGPGSVYGGNEGLVWAQTQGSRGNVCLQSFLTDRDGNFVVLLLGTSVSFWPHDVSVVFFVTVSDFKLPSGQKKNIYLWIHFCFLFFSCMIQNLTVAKSFSGLCFSNFKINFVQLVKILPV